MPPIAGLAGLRRLCLHQTYLPHMVTELGAGALSQLTELELNDIQEAAGENKHNSPEAVCLAAT